MGTMRVVMAGVALALLGGVGEARAQILLHVEQKRAEEMAEQRINDLRARASCHERHAATRIQIWTAFSGNHLPPEDKRERDALLQEADQQLRECVDQLQAGTLRDTCRNMARTEAQRAKCD